MLPCAGLPRLSSCTYESNANCSGYSHADNLPLRSRGTGACHYQAPTRTYRNPLLPEREIADPFVLRVDEKYYLYPTTDARGYEVFVSDDLVHWERKAHAFSDPRGGDWVPEVFHDTRGDGKFYLYY